MCCCCRHRFHRRPGCCCCCCCIALPSTRRTPLLQIRRADLAQLCGRVLLTVIFWQHPIAIALAETSVWQLQHFFNSCQVDTATWDKLKVSEDFGKKKGVVNCYQLNTAYCVPFTRGTGSSVAEAQPRSTASRASNDQPVSPKHNVYGQRGDCPDKPIDPYSVWAEDVLELQEVRCCRV